MQCLQIQGPGTYICPCKTDFPSTSVQLPPKGTENDYQRQYLCHSTIVRAVTLTVLTPRSVITLFAYRGKLCHDVWSRSLIRNAVKRARRESYQSFLS